MQERVVRVRAPEFGQSMERRPQREASGLPIDCLGITSPKDCLGRREGSTRDKGEDGPQGGGIKEDTLDQTRKEIAACDPRL